MIILQFFLLLITIKLSFSACSGGDIGKCLMECVMNVASVLSGWGLPGLAEQNCQHQTLQYCQRVERPLGATAGAYTVWQSRNTPRQIQTHTMGNNGKHTNSQLQTAASSINPCTSIYGTSTPHTHLSPLQNRKKTGYSYPQGPIHFIK